MAYDRLCMIGDGGIPKTYTAYAEATISGGWLVKLASGAQSTALGSTISTFDSTDIRVNAVSSSGTGGPCGGIAMYSVTSGQPVAIAYEGIFILESSAAITAGLPVASTTSGTNQGQVGLVTDGEEERKIGVALTQGADGEFVVVRLNI